MPHYFKKLIVLFSFLAAVVPGNNIYATEVRDYLEEFAYLEFQIGAVTTDMYRYLGWYPDEKEWMKDASQKAISDLDEIRGHLADLDLPDELTELKDIERRVITGLQEIYSGIEKKKEEDIKQEFETLNTLRSQYSEEFKGLL